MNTTSLEFLVQGSEATPYTVCFTIDGAKLTATCTCRAGIMGNLCKHRLNILNNDTSNITSNNADRVSTVQDWMQSSSAHELIASVAALEAEKRLIDEKLKKIKKQVVKALS
jgi:uncharacterized Zn finger protein